MVDAVISPKPKFTAIDANGDPYVGAKLYTYQTGTTTPKATWTDATKTVQNSNPIILDSNGQADVWIDVSTGAYRFKLTDPNDVVLWTKDDVSAVYGDPTWIEDYSADVVEMQKETDPYPAGAESLATTMAGEIERLRYQLSRILGESYWYIDPDTTLAAVATNIASLNSDITNLTNTKVAKAGDTMTGDLIIKKDTPVLTLDSNPVGDALLNYQVSDVKRGSLYWDNTYGLMIMAKYDTDGVTVLAKLEMDENNVSYNSNAMWHTGNLNPNSVIKGWVNFDGSSSPAVINDSFNVDSVVKNGPGNFTIVWTTDFANNHYVVTGMGYKSPNADVFVGCESLSTGSTAIGCWTVNGDRVDLSRVMVIAMGDQ